MIREVKTGNGFVYEMVRATGKKEVVSGGVMLLPHPVCCGIGFIVGVGKNFVGLNECLAEAEKRAFQVERRAIVMITSNVEEQKSFYELLRMRQYLLKIQTENPLHEGREMTVWVKYNPDPKGTGLKVAAKGGE